MPSAFFCRKEEYLKQFEDELAAKVFSEDQINRIIIRCQQLKISQTPEKALSLEALGSTLQNIMLARSMYAEKVKQAQMPKTLEERFAFLEKEMLVLKQQVVLLNCELELQKRITCVQQNNTAHIHILF